LPVLWGTVLVTGSVSGFGLNLSHKLRHKQDRLGRKLALFNSALGGYGHFSIEHNLSHHRHVPHPKTRPRLACASAFTALCCAKCQAPFAAPGRCRPIGSGHGVISRISVLYR